MSLSIELYQITKYVLKMASIVNFKWTANIGRLSSENSFEREKAEFWLRQRFDRYFLIENEDNLIKSNEDGQVVFHRIYQYVLAVLRERGPNNIINESSLIQVFENKLMDELANVLNNGNLSSIRRTERYLARRLGRMMNYWRLKRILWEQNERIEAFDDSLLMLLTNIKNGKFKGETRLETYFLVIFKRACIAKLRQKKLKKNMSIQPWPGIEEAFLKTLETKAWEQIRSYFDELDPDTVSQKLQFFKQNHQKCFDIFNLHYAMGYSYKEIAVIIKAKSADSIKTQVARCKEKWRRLIKESGIEM